MNGKGKKKIMKQCGVILKLSYIMSLVLLLTACQKDASIEVLQDFIVKQVQCETYKEAGGDSEALQKVFSPYFTEESYQKYLDDVVGYMYPQLYYMTNADKVIVKSIICKSVVPQENGLKAYTFEVNYQIAPVEKNDRKVEKIVMSDDTIIIIDANNKIQEVILLNTSDIIGKLFLDIKVQ